MKYKLRKLSTDGKAPKASPTTKAQGVLAPYVKLFGYKDVKSVVDKYGISHHSVLKNLDKKAEKWDFAEMFPEERARFVDPLALDLLFKLWKIDKDERLTAKQAMKHPYFESLDLE